MLKFNHTNVGSFLVFSTTCAASSSLANKYAQLSPDMQPETHTCFHEVSIVAIRL